MEETFLTRLIASCIACAVLMYFVFKNDKDDEE